MDIKAIAAGTPPATFTQTMSGQIDIGWSAPPYVIDDIKSGRVRLVARESDLEAFRNQTVRMNFARLDTLTGKADQIKRFLLAYTQTIDFLYSDDPAALKAYADFAEIPVEKAKLIRDEFFPKNNLSPTRLSGLDHAMADAQALKFINAPFTATQMEDFLKFYAK